MAHDVTKNAADDAAHCEIHPQRRAVSRCGFPSCAKPLCEDCRIITDDGCFCGFECARQYHSLFAHEGKRRRVSPLEAYLPALYKLILFLWIMFFVLLVISVYYPLPVFERIIQAYANWLR